MQGNQNVNGAKREIIYFFIRVSDFKLAQNQIYNVCIMFSLPLIIVSTGALAHRRRQIKNVLTPVWMLIEMYSRICFDESGLKRINIFIY